MGLRRLFFPSVPPKEAELDGSRRRYLLENAAASAVFSLGTGNFLAGFLSWMGAEPSFCALIAALPQLGCVLQLVSPFLFERLRCRKLAVCLCCFLFRFSLGFTALVPFLSKDTNVRLTGVFGLYLIAFLAAGFVTPGLNQWMLDLAPVKNRGRFFARRDILSSLFNAGMSFFMGWQLDRFTEQGNPLAGYLIVFGTLTLLAVADILLLGSLREIPSAERVQLRARDLLAPLRSPDYRPIVLFLVFWFAALNLSSAFLPVYQLTILGMSHRLITGMNVLASAVGIAGSWLWGRIADRAGWRRVVLCSGLVLGCGYLGWVFLTPETAPFAGPLLQCLTVSGSAAFGMANINIQYAACPSSGKTAYLGVANAASNLVGYTSAAIGAWTQPLLAVWLGQKSIPLLFLGSSIGLFLCVWYGRRKLCKT